MTTFGNVECEGCWELYNPVGDCPCGFKPKSKPEQRACVQVVLNDLLNCAHCGGAASFGETEEGGEYIECGSCGITTKLYFACGEDPKPLMTEAWNRRAV
jgi:hypothetical protein